MTSPLLSTQNIIHSCLISCFFSLLQVSSLLSSRTVLVDCRTTPVITSSHPDIQVASSRLHLYPSFCIFFAPVPPPCFSFYNVWLDDFRPFKLSSKLILKQEAAVLCVWKWTGVTWQDINDCLQKLQPPTLHAHFNDRLWKLRTLKCLVLNVAPSRRFLSVEIWSSSSLRFIPQLHCSKYSVLMKSHLHLFFPFLLLPLRLFKLKLAGLISCCSYSDFIVSTSLFVFFSVHLFCICCPPPLAPCP